MVIFIIILIICAIVWILQPAINASAEVKITSEEKEDKGHLTDHINSVVNPPKRKRKQKK
jgi:hypothetical protein